MCSSLGDHKPITMTLPWQQYTNCLVFPGGSPSHLASAKPLAQFIIFYGQKLELLLIQNDFLMIFLMQRKSWKNSLFEALY